MDRSFEHTVLAYLDGLLDKREEREFLKEVSRNTEKRAILEQFRKLDRTLKNKSTPLAVPLKVQRALAEKIPVLEQVVPPAVGGALTGASQSSSLSASAAFLSRKVISLLLAGGATIALVTTLTLTDVFSTDESAERYTDETAGTAVTENSISERISGTRETNSDEQSNAYSAPATNSHAAGASSHAAGTSSHTARMNATHGAIAETQAAETQAAEAHRATTATDLTSDEQMHVSATTTSDVLEYAPLVLRPVADPTANGITRYPPQQHSLAELLGGSVYAYLETGAADVRGSGNPSGAIEGVYLIGLRAEFSPHLAAGAEFGRSTFTHEALVSRIEALSAESGTQVVIIDNALQSTTQPWLRLHGLYTLNPASRLRFQGDVGAGVLLVSDSPVMWSAGISSLYALSTSLHLRAGLHYSGAWMQPSTAAPAITTSESGVIGIIRRAEEAGTVYSSSVEFRIGFGILLW